MAFGDGPAGIAGNGDAAEGSGQGNGPSGMGGRSDDFGGNSGESGSNSESGGNGGGDRGGRSDRGSSDRRGGATGAFDLDTSSLSKDISGLGAPTGFEGFGIGDRAPGMSMDRDTAQQSSRGTRGDGAADHHAGFGLDSTVQDMAQSPRGFAGQLNYETDMSLGAQAAKDAAGIETVASVIGMKGPVGLVADTVAGYALNPTSRRAYDSVRGASKGLVDLGASALGQAANYGLGSTAPGQALELAAAGYNYERQAQKATEFGIKASDRRSAANKSFDPSAPDNNDNALSGHSGQPGTAGYNPAPVATPDYDSWDYTSHLRNAFS